MKAQEWFPEITAAAFPYTDLDVLARSFDQDVWSHAFGLVWFLPGVAGDIPTPSLATFQWFWGTDRGTKWDGASALLGMLYTDIQFAGPKLTKQTVEAVSAGCARRSRAWAARTATARSRSRRRLRLPRAAPPSAARRWAGGTRTRRGPATTTCRLNGKGEYRTSTRPSATSPGTFPKAKKKFFDTKNSTSVFPALPASRTQVADVPLPELPEHRQHHHHTRRRQA